MKILTCLILICSIHSYVDAQSSFKGRIIDENKHPIQDVSVAIHQSSSSILVYDFSDKNGKFEIPCSNKEKASYISFTILGFETIQIYINEFRNNQTVTLQSKAFSLKEVNIRPDKIRKSNDTLSYNVLSFKQGQDRSIADVIKKMPGLEVKGGRISFEGKPINKFYIEGMDLMGSKYAQASENLAANMVSSVQVIQNHQPIKVLKGIQFSDQAALNIILKDNVKNTWAGILDVGMGSAVQDDANYLYSGRLMGMKFGHKSQNISLYKCDNTGKNISQEISDLAALDRDNQKEDGLLKGLVMPANEIDSKRITFNKSHVVATNHLIRTKQKNDLRVQLNYLWDKKEAYTSNQIEYLDLDGAILFEENNIESTDSQLKGDITYTINKNGLYVNNLIHGDIECDRSSGNSILNNQQIAQKVKVLKRYITEDFEIISRLKNGNSINFSSQNTYSYLPGRLLTVEGIIEKLGMSVFDTHNYASFSHEIKGFTLNQKLGFRTTIQQMEVNYQDIDKEEKYTQQNLYLASSMHFEKSSFKINASLRTDLMNRWNEENKEVKISFHPSLSVKYDCNATTSATIKYSYSESPNSLKTMYNTPIFTSYRVQTSYTGNLENKGLHTASFFWKYQHPIKGLFSNLIISWNRKTNEVLYKSSYDTPIYKRTPTEHRYSANTYIMNGNIARSIYWGKTFISFDARQIWSAYYLLLKEVKTPWQLRNTSATLKLSMQPIKEFSYELASKIQTSKQVNQTDKSLSNNRITSFNHSASLFFFPMTNIELGAKSEIYHSSDKSISNNLFTDMHLSYKNKWYELRLACNNIFGNQLYERQVLSSTTNIYSTYRLRPREILLSFSINL